MSFNVQDFVREADDQLRRYADHAARFRDLAGDTDRQRNELTARLAVARTQIADAVLPDLSEPSFAGLAQKIGIPELMGILRRSREHETRLDTRIAAIEATDTYRDRETIRGRAEHQLEEVRPLLEHALSDLRALDSLPRMRELVARNYGTPSYPHRGVLRYFKREFLDDWKRADEACAALKVAAFPEVAARYRDRQEQAEVLGRTVRDLDQQLQIIADQEGERAHLLATKAALPDVLRLETGKRVASLLQSSPKLIQSLDFPETLQGRLREMDGLEHQVEYLQSLRVKVEQDAAEVEERAAKLRGERDRYQSNLYRYRNKSFSNDQFDKRFRRDARYDKLYTRYRRTGDTVYVFSDYNRPSALESFLWWDVITDGRLDGNFIPQVQEYAAAHPEYQYDRSVFAESPGGNSSGDSGDFGNFGGPSDRFGSAGDFGDNS
ncbi:MAG: hypothetical protein H7Z41_10460 [Cytophagales bacterium]|nr:hypothetical protein [Armatimonadota bacterium]